MHQSRARRWDSTVAPDQLLINRLSAISLGAICHHCLPCPCHHHRSINIILKALSVKILRWQNQPKFIHHCSWINHALLPYFLPPSIVTKYKFDVKILNQSRDFLLATVLISPPTWDLISEIRCRPLLESPWEGSALAARLMSDILEGTWETDGKPRKTQETSKHHFALFLAQCGNGFFLSHRRRTTILQGINLPSRDCHYRPERSLIQVYFSANKKDSSFIYLSQFFNQQNLMAVFSQNCNTNFSSEGNLLLLSKIFLSIPFSHYFWDCYRK